MARTYSNLVYHLVFSTKDRKPLIAQTFQADLHGYLGGIVRDLGGIAIEVGGVADHVHLLVRLKPTLALADALREIKSGSSKWLNQEKFKLHKFGWQDGYCRVYGKRIAGPTGPRLHSAARATPSPR